MAKRNCSADGCDRSARTKGLCKAHYQRLLRHGHIGSTVPTPEQRFWAKVDQHGPVPEARPDLGPCWLWTAGKINGYGFFRAGAERQTYAHRFAYELLVGAVPDGLQLDHLCRNPACCNPSHVEPVTIAVNLARGETNSNRAYKTHCAQGHEFTPENTYVAPNGYRKCRTCQRARQRRTGAA